MAEVIHPDVLQGGGIEVIKPLDLTVANVQMKASSAKILKHKVSLYPELGLSWPPVCHATPREGIWTSESDRTSTEAFMREIERQRCVLYNTEANSTAVTDLRDIDILRVSRAPQPCARFISTIINSL